MNHRGSFEDPQQGADGEETSGVTSLAPVPVKTMRLSGVSDSDRTAFFHVSTLLERGKALATRSQQQPPPAPPGEQLTPALPTKPGIRQQIREASFARKASAVMLPLVAGMLLLKPVFKEPKSESPPASAPASASSPAVAAPEPAASPQISLAATPPQPPPALPRGVSLEKAAVDAVAGGDFQRALTHYQELYRRSPDNAAYRQAQQILERRVRGQAP